MAFVAQVVAQADDHVQQIAHQHDRRDAVIAAHLGGEIAVLDVVLGDEIELVGAPEAGLV